jgi:transcriptional regulator with XRE-family HTH domain
MRHVTQRTHPYDDAFERIRLEFIAEHEAGRAPTLYDYAARYPNYAAALADFILDYLRMENAAVRTAPADAASPAAERALERALAGIVATAPAAQALALADWRKERGWSLGELARRLLLPVSLALKIERGQIVTWPGRLAEKLAEAMGATPEQAEAALRATAGNFRAEAAAFFADGDPDVATVAQRRRETFAFDEALSRERLTPEQAAYWKAGR